MRLFKNKILDKAVLTKQLFDAVEQKDDRRAIKAVEQGADVNELMYIRPGENETALMLVCGSNTTISESPYKSRSIAFCILSKNPDLEVKSNKGFTALTYAVINGDAWLVEKLIQQGANVNTSNNYGFTPLMMAALANHNFYSPVTEYVKITELLLDAGAKVNAKSTYGMTALMLASNGGYDSIATLLLSRGADIMPRNYKDEDALSMAKGSTYNLLIAWKRENIFDKEEKIDEILQDLNRDMEEGV